MRTEALELSHLHLPSLIRSGKCKGQVFHPFPVFDFVAQTAPTLPVRILNKVSITSPLHLRSCCLFERFRRSAPRWFGLRELSSFELTYTSPGLSSRILFCSRSPAMAAFYSFDIIPAFLLAMAGSSLFGSCSASDLPASYVFGDSLVDSGNNNYLVSLSKANYAPNGIDFMPYRMPTGRYTNGRTIPDIVGQELGFPHFTPPYLAPTTAGDTILAGVNYASGGGGILNETGQIFGGRLNLDAQIDNFENTRQEIVSMVGAPAASNLLKKALFSVVIGSNDFLNNYLTPVLSESKRRSVPPVRFVQSMITKLRPQITRLYKLGARKLVIVNVGPIGCIPYQRDLNPNAGENCAAVANQLAQCFNLQLKNLVVELHQTLKEASFVYADVYNIVYDIIKNYSSYGFENANSACCRSAGRFGGLVPCGPTSRVCADRSKYVFWDAYHPSDAANAIIAKRLVDGDSRDVSPMNVRQLLRV